MKHQHFKSWRHVWDHDDMRDRHMWLYSIISYFYNKKIDGVRSLKVRASVDKRGYLFSQSYSFIKHWHSCVRRRHADTDTCNYIQLYHNFKQSFMSVAYQFLIPKPLKSTNFIFLFQQPSINNREQKKIKLKNLKT